MRRSWIAGVLLAGTAGLLGAFVGTGYAKDPAKGCEHAGHDSGRYSLYRLNGDDVVVLDSVTGTVYRTDDLKTVLVVDAVRGKVITRGVDVLDQRSGKVIRPR